MYHLLLGQKAGMRAGKNHAPKAPLLSCSGAPPGLPARRDCGNSSGMSNHKMFLLFFGSVMFGLLAARAGEFPDDWTWDDKPEFRADHATLEGKSMPPFHVSDWINGGITASAIKGKVLVVDLYATWCGPCMQAIAHNNELLKKYAAQGLVIVGVCTSSDGQEVFASNAAQHHLTYPAACDPELKTEKAYAVHYYPTYAIIDRKGIVRVVGLQPEHVEAVIQKLLAEPAP